MIQKLQKSVRDYAELSLICATYVHGLCSGTPWTWSVRVIPAVSGIAATKNISIHGSW